MPIRGILYSFNGGELSRRMEGRVDLDGVYDRGAAEMFNWVSTVEGPALKRSGTRHIRAAAASSTWLSSFVFNVTQAYVLEWFEEAVRFFTNGAQIESSPGVPYEVAVPYAAAEAPAISSVQSFDRLYLAHENHAPASLTRTAASTFAHETLELKNGPFEDYNSNKARTITLSGTLTVGGSATATASTGIFDTGMVGSPIIIEADDFSDVKAWEPGYDGITVGTKRRSDGKVYQCTAVGSDSRTGTVQPTHTSGAEWDGTDLGQDINANNAGGVKWEYLYDRFGIGTITAVGSSTSATIEVTRRFPDSLTGAASHKWALGAFSDYAGWPKLVCIAFGRMIFFKGVEIYGSVVGDYGGGQVNFAPLTDSGLFAADMAFRRRLELPDPPLWVRADKEALVIGTARGEYLITAINTTEPVSGDNLQALPQSSYGSAAVRPIQVGTASLFVQRGARKIREAEYTYQRERFVGLNITVWARHITRSGIRQLAFQQEPEEMLWAVREDGVLAAHPHSPEQQVKGFSRCALGAGAVISSVAIPSDDGAKDDLWLLAELDGARHVLKLADWWEEIDARDHADENALEAARSAAIKDAFFVDYGVSYDGTPKAEFNDGLDHLVGREVWILADGGVVPPQVVQASEPRITLPYEAGKVHIGIGYYARFTPMRPEVRGAPTQQGLRKRVVRALFRLIDAAALIVRDPASGRDERLIDRPGSSKMNEAVPLFNGDTENKAVGGGYDRNGQFTLISDAPLPAMVTAILPSMEVEQ